MNRRDWMKTAGSAAALAAFPLDLLAERASPGSAKLETEIVRLNLRHTWTTTMSSSEYRDVIYTRYTRDGVTGLGEGAPIVRYKEDAKSAETMLKGIQSLIEQADPWAYQKVLAQVFQQVKGEHAGKAALDIALFDWIGKRLNEIGRASCRERVYVLV